MVDSLLLFVYYTLERDFGKVKYETLDDAKQRLKILGLFFDSDFFNCVYENKVYAERTAKVKVFDEKDNYKLYKSIFTIKNTVSERENKITAICDTFAVAKEEILKHCDWYRNNGTGKIYQRDIYTNGVQTKYTEELVYQN